MTNRTFAEIFNDALNSRGVSPGEAADRLTAAGYPINRGTLNRWRLGENNPSRDSLEVVRRLPRVLGLSPAEEGDFLRAAGKALEIPIHREVRSYGRIAFPQRIHFGAGELPPFAGRDEELAELRRLILKKQSVLITGLGGIGKTRLAQELLRSSAGYFAHGCEYLAVLSGQESNRIIRNVARLLGIEINPAELSPGNRRFVLGHLREQLRGVDLLFLIDNVESSGQVRDLVEYLPNITWVMTARRVSLKRIGVHSVQLGLPTREGAIAIFQTYVKEAAVDKLPNHQLVEALLEAAGGLPIVIRLMSGLVANGSLSTVEELEAWLSEGGLLREGLHSGKMRRFFDQMLAGVSPQAREVFETCGMFATRSIQMVNLIGVCKLTDIQSMPRLLEFLADFSLIDIPDNSRVELHPLLHEYAQSRLIRSPRYSAVWEGFKEHYLTTARSVADSARDFERDYRSLLRMEPNLLKVADALHQSRDWPRLKAMWPALSGYLWNTGNHPGYEAFDWQCLDAARVTHDEVWEGIILSELGFAAMERGANIEANDLFRRSQAIHDAAADQGIKQARLRRYRASLAMKQGQLDDAFALLAECEQQLSRLTNPPEADLEVAYLLFNCARMSACFRRGELADAEDAGLAAERLYQDLPMKNGGHRVGEFLLELGDIRFKSGKFEDAHRTWAMMLATRGGLLQLPDHAEAQLRLSWLAARQGALESAAQTANEAIQVFMHFARPERYEVTNELLAHIEGNGPLLEFDDLLRGYTYPSY